MNGYLGLGSNEGDRLANLRAARDALPGAGVEVLAGSSVYETEPQGDVTDQADFLNACLRVDTELGPEQLLAVCKDVERALGREPGGVGLQHRPHPEQLVHLLLRRDVYEGALSGSELDPTVGLQALQRLSHGLTAHPEVVRQLGLDDVPTPLQGAVHDQLDDRVVDGLAKGGGTQHPGGGVGQRVGPGGLPGFAGGIGV